MQNFGVFKGAACRSAFTFSSCAAVQAASADVYDADYRSEGCAGVPHRFGSPRAPAAPRPVLTSRFVLQARQRLRSISCQSTSSRTLQSPHKLTTSPQSRSPFRSQEKVGEKRQREEPVLDLNDEVSCALFFRCCCVVLGAHGRVWLLQGMLEAKRQVAAKLDEMKISKPVCDT
eukprot:823825-Rhodomonas_salina.1